eukprot:4751882-Amphidinium_carterae.1
MRSPAQEKRASAQLSTPREASIRTQCRCEIRTGPNSRFEWGQSACQSELTEVSSRLSAA